MTFSSIRSEFENIQDYYLIIRLILSNACGGFAITTVASRLHVHILQNDHTHSANTETCGDTRITNGVSSRSMIAERLFSLIYDYVFTLTVSPRPIDQGMALHTAK